MPLPKKGRGVGDTTLSAGVEQKATRFVVNSESGELTMSRPGGVLWPLVTQPTLRIVLFYSVTYNADAKAKMARKLCLSWSSTNADTNHSSLNVNSGRDYVSNGYGMQRKDFTK
jgi:hypothetical protein